MTHDLDDISTRACWTRLNETPEDIARMSMRFMKEFSTQLEVGPWDVLEDEWDGTEAGLIEVIKRNPITDDDGEPIPGDGYSTTLRLMHSDASTSETPSQSALADGCE